MKKIKHSLIVGILILSSLTMHAEKRKILFIGNSYTAVNDLPNTLKSLALSMGDTLEIDSNTPGGMTFNGHTSDATTLAKLATPGWDYVVLQAQSQEPSFDPAQVAVDTYPYAKILDSLVHVTNPCAETIFYMTWGRKNGDASNCAAYPPICTYAGMQQRLRESYLEMALNNNATCAPAGVAWKNFRDTYPSVELYNADESHPSASGTYLVACTFYSSIYHKACMGASFVLAGVATTDAANIQSIASHTVLDSLENWQQYGSLPKASFNYTNNQNQYTFTNTSLRSTQYEWNFGDGTAINTQTNPNHTYTSIGNFNVTLKALSSCGKYDVSNDTIKISSLPSGLNESNYISSLQVFLEDRQLCLMNTKHADKLKIYSPTGSLIKEFTLDSGLNKFLLHMAPGIYLYSVLKENRLQLQGKIDLK